MANPPPSPPEPPLVEATRAPAGPSLEEVWYLLGRADVIVRALLEAPDRAARQRCQERARAWLRDVGQAWVHTPAPPVPGSRPGTGRQP